MNPLSYIQNMTAADAGRYARIALQWVAATLVTHGTISPTATWIEPSIGLGVGIVSLAWTLYGNRIQAKINEVAAMNNVQKVVVNDAAIVKARPSNVTKAN